MTTNRQSKINDNVYFPFTYCKMISVFFLIFTTKKLTIYGEDFPRKWWLVLHIGNRTFETTFLKSRNKRRFQKKFPKMKPHHLSVLFSIMFLFKAWLAPFPGISKSMCLISNPPIEWPLFFFRLISAPGTEEILKSRGRAGPAAAATALSKRPPAPHALPSVAAPGALGSRGPRPCRRSPGLGGAGRSLGPAGAGGEGRPERVGDTRGGAGRRSGRTPPWEETRQVWPGRRVPAGRRLAPPPTNTNTQPRARSSAPSPPSEPQLLRRSCSPPVVVPAPDLRPPHRARSGQDGPGGQERPRDLLRARPGSQFGGLSFEPPTPHSPSPLALAYASALSCSLSARRHELQRRLSPADQHAGPHDPRGVRSRPALRGDLRRRRRWGRRRRRGHQQDVLLPALHGHRPELGRLLVGTGRRADTGRPGPRGLRALLSEPQHAGTGRDELSSGRRKENRSWRRKVVLLEFVKALPAGAGQQPGVLPPSAQLTPGWVGVRARRGAVLPRKRVLRPNLLASREPGQEGGRRAVQEDAAGVRVTGVSASRTPPLHPLRRGAQRASPLSRPAGGRSGGAVTTKPNLTYYYQK